MKQKNLKKKNLSVQQNNTEDNLNENEIGVDVSDKSKFNNQDSLDVNSVINTKNINDEMSKVFSNLITTLYKMKENKKCEEYIKQVSYNYIIILIFILVFRIIRPRRKKRKSTIF